MDATTTEPIPPSHERLARLTRRYARYSRSAGGLASVLGGGLALVAYVVGGLAPPEGIPGRAALALAPFVWIAAKEVLRRRLYQTLGRVGERWDRKDRRLHVGFTAFTTVVSAVVIIGVGWPTAAGGGAAPTATWGYVALVAAMPVLVWFFMRTPLEYVVGVFLVCQAALMLAGSHYELWEQPQAPLAALALVVLGVRQHLEFRRLRRELDEVRPVA